MELIDFVKRKNEKLLERSLELTDRITLEGVTPAITSELQQVRVDFIKMVFFNCEEVEALDLLAKSATYTEMYMAMGEEYANKLDNYKQLKGWK